VFCPFFRHNSVSVSNFLGGNRFRWNFFIIDFTFICSLLTCTTGRNEVNFEFLNTHFQPVQIVFKCLGCLRLIFPRILFTLCIELFTVRGNLSKLLLTRSNKNLTQRKQERILIQLTDNGSSQYIVLSMLLKICGKVFFYCENRPQMSHDLYWQITTPNCLNSNQSQFN
jgi:hypothetical protein